MTHQPPTSGVEQPAPTSLVRLTRRRRMSEATFERMMARLAKRRAVAADRDELLDAYADTRAESRFEGPRSEPPDCLTCGACCAHFQRVPVLISDPTPRRFAWRVWDEEPDGASLDWLRREPARGRCVALSGRVGEKVGCAIYELRPRACRAFDAGSDRCHAVRRLYGLESRLPEEAEQTRGGALDLEAFEREARAIEGMEAAARAPRRALETTRFLGALLEYNEARLAEIAAEARRLGALLEARRRHGAASIATDGAREVSAALASLRAIEDLEAWDESELAALNHELLAVALSSQAALEQAAARLAALGEVVFAELGLRIPDEGREGLEWKAKG